MLWNLFFWFKQKEYIVATSKPHISELGLESLPDAEIFYICKSFPVQKKFSQFFSLLAIPKAVINTLSLIRKYSCSAVVGVFPDIHFLIVSYLVHRISGLPWIVYMHDLMSENLRYGYLGILSRWLERRVAKNAQIIYVLNESMAEYLQKKHGRSIEILRHCYNETIGDTEIFLKKSSYSVCFSGSVGAINIASLKRVIDALRRIDNVVVKITSAQGKEVLEKLGVALSGIEVIFIPRRSDMLSFLKEQDLLISCLSWPDETAVGIEELSTIFPTKMPEYLASGRPILIHCPSNYFLARFSREHDCAWVVDERSPEAVATLLLDLQSDEITRKARCANALLAARLFAGGEDTANKFREGINNAKHLHTACKF